MIFAKKKLMINLKNKIVFNHKAHQHKEIKDLN